MNNRRYYKLFTAILLGAGFVFVSGNGSILASDDVNAIIREDDIGDVSYVNEDNLSDSAYDASSPEGSSDSANNSSGNSGSSDSSSGDKTQNSSQNKDQSSTKDQSQGSSGNSSSDSGNASSGNSGSDQSSQNSQNSKNSQNSQSSQNTQSSGNTQTSSGTQNTSSGQNASAAQSTAPSVPKIYAATGVSSTVNIKPAENANVLTVGNYLMKDLNAAVVASDGTNLTNEVWQHAFVPTIAWVPTPAGYNAANPGPYSFLWTGIVPKGSVIYSDAKMTKAAAVNTDIPVVVTFNVTDAAANKAKGSVSANDASNVPRTGDDFTPGLWIYFIVIGLVVCVCSFILYRDTARHSV